MRALLWVVVLAFAGWSGWWWIASDTARKGAADWFAARQAEGWEAHHQGIDVQGYPNRIDLTIRAPRLAPPQGGWGWEAPFAQLFALSYKPWHLVAALPDRQTLTTPAGPATVTADSLRASLVLVPGGDLRLERFQIVGEGLRLSGALTGGAAHLSLATRPAEGQPLAHDLGLEARGIAVAPDLLAALPPDLLPPEAALLRADTMVTLDRALDRHAGETPPRITALSLREVRLEWGAIRLRLSGDLTPDRTGLAEGRLDLRLDGAQELLALAQAVGLVTPETRPAWDNVLGALAPQGQTLELPLRLSEGVIALGPMVIGPAPPLR